ncbi:MAG: 5-formyltetrahydrofolate cyclo-ligase [Candidatus Korarchaeum sp.]|nr:5-formyltetrahydrofolate cyclo-ligase [Candidatus Korarchaeum sp.]MDW8036070.1 5-formyltetrahydrofolate cyclo-ligase [Candidatus Korarchaeum sp.]
MSLREEKEMLRKLIWRVMEERGVALFPKPVKGRIPNFSEAEEAARKLSFQEEWERAEVIFVNPDSPQRHVRYLGLSQGKIVVMATPRLREGFLILDPKGIPAGRHYEASTISGAFKYGRKVGLDVPKVDLKVTGSVAVDERGGRVGKGHGYSDLEYGILGEIGAIGRDTPIATTVHDLQVVGGVPMEGHDMPVSLIVTPTRVIRTGRFSEPKILWELVTPELEREIPLLRELRGKRFPQRS